MVRAVKELTCTCIWTADAASCHTEQGRDEEHPVPSGPGRTQPPGLEYPHSPTASAPERSLSLLAASFTC